MTNKEIILYMIRNDMVLEIRKREDGTGRDNQGDGAVRYKQEEHAKRKGPAAAYMISEKSSGTPAK